ncbi:hypothetical protein AALP_AA6G171200 [Arabis alpina]|uniref:DUF287 domain-containing protein n=1 Tax=Arabis alpina TaxID=50452 RepID=A0A087GPT2_ARAAL|nr:hypothetical protein AALP_AA6G171200 [Arabis alpina]
MMETGEKDDYIDPIVDGWKRRLVVENKNIWFKDLLKKDVDGRKTETKAIPLRKRKGKDKESVDVDVKEMILAEFKELGEKMTSMEAKVMSRLDELETRMNGVENSLDGGSDEADKSKKKGSKTMDKRKNKGKRLYSKLTEEPLDKPNTRARRTKA